jgi:hypothetical protein
MAYLSERPTAQQWQIAAWMFIAVLAAMGSVGLWFGLRAGVENRDAAQQLIRLGIASMVAAVALWGFKRGVEWFAD